MKKHFNIAIDGPSGAGKSTLAKRLSRELGILYLDTGALYRAVGLKAYCEQWKEDDSFVEERLKGTDIIVKYDVQANKQLVFLDGEDVTSAIRQDFVSGYGSRFSALPSVRAKLLSLQRSIAAEYSSVLDGRDIGTCVLPNAKYKFYLTASVDERARRRYEELIQLGQDADFELVKADIESRDFRDMNRPIAPLRKADDAIEINTDTFTQDDTAAKILSYIKE